VATPSLPPGAVVVAPGVEVEADEAGVPVVVLDDPVDDVPAGVVDDDDPLDPVDGAVVVPTETPAEVPHAASESAQRSTRRRRGTASDARGPGVRTRVRP
jgi:hypothetical protein